MRPMKKMEIVIDASDSGKVEAILHDMNVSGFSRLRDVSGTGGRGIRSGDDPAGALKNHYLMTVVEANEVAAIVERLRPILRRGGGICIVSDCEWVVH